MSFWNFDAHQPVCIDADNLKGFLLVWIVNKNKSIKKAEEEVKDDEDDKTVVDEVEDGSSPS